MSEIKHKFTIGNGSKLSAVKNDGFLQAQLTAASKGGASAFNLFQSDLSALNQLYQTIATGGDTVWLDGKDTTSGLPTQYVVVGDTSLTLGVYVNKEGLEVLKAGTGGIDNVKQFGFSYMTLVTSDANGNQRVTQVATNILNYAGGGIAKIEVGNGLQTLIKKTVGVVKNFLKKMISLAAESGAVGGAVTANEMATKNAEQAAKDTAVEAEEVEITKDEVIQVGIEFADVAGIVFSLGEIGMTIILNLLAKEILSYVRFYNDTEQTIEFSICWIKQDAASISAPVLPLNPIEIPGLGPAWTPPWIIGDKPVHYVNMVFGNTDSLKGVAFVLKARPVADFPGFNVMVNIPNTGDNSMSASFGVDDDCFEFWQKNKNKNQSLELSSRSGKYTLSMANNQINGKSPSPVDGAESYNYEHIIVLSAS